MLNIDAVAHKVVGVVGIACFLIAVMCTARGTDCIIVFSFFLAGCAAFHVWQLPRRR